MGADAGIDLPPRGFLQAREIFYTAMMADASLTPADVVARLQHIAKVEYLQRRGSSAVIHADIALPPEEGHGYFSLTRLGSEMLLIVENFRLQKQQTELVQDGGLLRFDFRLSGNVAVNPHGSKSVRLDRPGLFIAAPPFGSASTRLTAARSHERGVTLLVAPHAFEAGFRQPANRGSRLGGGTSLPTESNTNAVPLSAAMFDIIGRLLKFRYSGRLSLFYTEGLALELLCVALSPLLKGGNATLH